MGYVYLLTPIGMKERMVMPKRFLSAKEKEHEKLELEVQQLKKEVQRIETGIKT